MRLLGDISVGIGLSLSLRPDSAPGISVNGAGLEVANGTYVRTGFKVGRAGIQELCSL